MAQQFCELSNLTAATNPIVGHPGAGEPGTPVLYDTAVYPGGVALGPGTKSQIPTMTSRAGTGRSEGPVKAVAGPIPRS